jgi:hypothetical protein
MKHVILSIFILCLAFNFFSQTSVSGGIYQNTTWNVAGSPYLVTSSIVVFPGKTLTIEPGVEVLVTPDYSFNTGNLQYIEIRGNLVAIGTPSNPIVFRSSATENPGSHTWMGINIKGSQGATFQMDNFKLFDSYYGLYNDISEPGVSYNFNNCHFKNNNYAIQLNADLNYSNCLFELNGVGQAAQISYGTLTATNCQFLNNFCSFTWSNAVNVTNCLFQGNTNNIIGSPGVFDNCQFINNEFGFAEAYGHTIQNCYFSQNNVGIENTGGSTIVNSVFENNTIALKIADNTSLTNNEIVNNQIGVAVTAYNPTSTIISDNKICFNAQYNLQNLTDKNFQVNANCFCSQDSTYIESFILDGYDDITRGLVNYAIYDDSCESILNYIVKVQLGELQIAELNPQNTIELLAQNGQLVKVKSTKEQRLYLLDLSGVVISISELIQGINEITFPQNHGLYLLKSNSGDLLKIAL